MKRISLEECSCECLNNEKCKVWTWVKNYFGADNHGCWLKTAKGTQSSMSNAISGPKFCAGPCLQKRTCDEDGVDYYGNDLVGLKGISLEECSCACLSNEKCKVWTWVKNYYGADNHGCWLKTAKGTKSSMPTAISGPKFCAGPCHPERTCDEDGVDYSGNDLVGLKGISLEECSCACQNNEKCKVWTWVKNQFGAGNHGCWLKTAKGTPGSMSTAISGPKFCQA